MGIAEWYKLGAVLTAGLVIKYTGFGNPMGLILCTLLWPVTLGVFLWFGIKRYLIVKAPLENVSKLETAIALIVTSAALIAGLLFYRHGF